MACLVSGPLSPKGPLVYQPVLTATQNDHDYNEDDSYDNEIQNHHNLMCKIMMMIVMLTMLINLNMTLFKEVECSDPVSPQSGYIEVSPFIILILVEVSSPSSSQSSQSSSQSGYIEVGSFIILISRTIITITIIITIINTKWLY